MQPYAVIHIFNKAKLFVFPCNANYICLRLTIIKNQASSI